MKCLIVLALPRTGTNMLCSALRSHPDIDNVTHEFRGGFWKFIQHPRVLSNYVRWWMRLPFIRVIHMYREDDCAGARSMLMMHYLFPDGVVDLPENEVLALAKQRKEWDEKMREVADYSFSYESLLNNGIAETFPKSFSDKFCDHIGLERHALTTTTLKARKIQLRNERAVRCLAA